jgi:hypothetical protein
VIQACSETLGFKVHKLVNYILSKEEMPEQWKEYTIAPILKNGSKINYRNYRGISLLSNLYKIYPVSSSEV